MLWMNYSSATYLSSVFNKNVIAITYACPTIMGVYVHTVEGQMTCLSGSQVNRLKEGAVLKELYPGASSAPGWDLDEILDSR